MLKGPEYNTAQVLPETSLGTGLKISTGLLKRLTPEFLEVNYWNNHFGKRLTRSYALCVVAPPVGGAMALVVSILFNNPEVALLGGPFLIFGGPASTMALHLQNSREAEKLKNKIDNSILSYLLDQDTNEEVNLDQWELDELLDVWNPVRRASDRALARRLAIYRGLLGTNPGLAVLLISPFILFEKNGMLEKEMIIPIGVQNLMSLVATEKDEGFSLFTMTALNLLYQKNASRGSVQKSSIANPSHLRPEQKSIIKADPESLSEKLQASLYKERERLIDWYDAHLSYLKRTSSLAPAKVA